MQKPYLDKWLHPMGISRKAGKKSKDLLPSIHIILCINIIINTNT